MTAQKGNIIYLDMDGVLADFDRLVLEKLGRTYDFAAPDDDEMWTALTKVDHLYLQLEPTPYACEIMDAALCITDRVEILTAVPRRTTLPHAEEDKYNWIVKYFGEEIKVNFGPHSRNKWEHCKPGDILVDDRPSNIEEWVTKGQGIGILHDYKNHYPTLDAINKLKGVL
jgi:5'(3')-deoxyribonucleotidase